MGRETVQEWVKEEVVGDVLEKLDDIRSQRGTFTNVIPGTPTMVLNVAAGKVFHVKTILATVRIPSGVADRATFVQIRLWHIRSAVSCGLIQLIQLAGTQVTRGPGESMNYVATNIQGFVIVASTVTRFRLQASAINGSVTIGIGGILRDRMAGETTSGTFV